MKCLNNCYYCTVKNQTPSTKGVMMFRKVNTHSPVNNEKGAVLVIALMLLAVVTLLGISALNTTNTEIRISGNEKVYKQAFYNAEAGVAYVLTKGVSWFTDGAVDEVMTIPSDLASVAPGIGITYTDIPGSPRRVQVRVRGEAQGGGVVNIVAGLMSTTAGAQPQSGQPIPPSY